MKKTLTIFFSALLVFLTVFSSGLALAEDTAAVNVEQIKEICTRLPNEKTVSLDHKEDILTAKKAYGAMDTAQKLELGSENVAKITVAFEAFTPLLMADVVSRIEALPDKANKADKAEVQALWEDYDLLPLDAKEAVNKKLVSKLKATVKAVAPALLEEDKDEDSNENKTDDKKDNANNKEKTKAVNGTGFAVWEIAVLSILAVLIVINIAMIVMAAVKIFKASKRA